MTPDDVKRIVNDILKSSFSQKRLGDRPTDALQLANKRYVDNAAATLGGKVFGGVVTAAGAAGGIFPSGWSISKLSTGRYQINHTLATNAYAVTATVNDSTKVTILNIEGPDAAKFLVECLNQTGATTWTDADTQFYFIVTTAA